MLALKKITYLIMNEYSGQITVNIHVKQKLADAY